MRDSIVADWEKGENGPAIFDVIDVGKSDVAKKVAILEIGRNSRTDVDGGIQRQIELVAVVLAGICDQEGAQTGLKRLESRYQLGGTEDIQPVGRQSAELDQVLGGIRRVKDDSGTQDLEHGFRLFVLLDGFLVS